MDNLSRMAVLATNAGMSYGQWMALQGDTKPERNEEKGIPDGFFVCRHCGKLFRPNMKKNQRFCDMECQRQSYYAKRRKRRAERAAMQNEVEEE